MSSTMADEKITLTTRKPLKIRHAEWDRVLDVFFKFETQSQPYIQR
jgi:hypothetical protein